MHPATTAVQHLLDRLFTEHAVITKRQLLSAAETAEVGEDALVIMRGLPDGEYTHEGLDARLDATVREREDTHRAGLDGHSEPGWEPESVRRHPNIPE
jgi:hypothetical protein